MKAMKERVHDTLRVDTASDQIRNIKGHVSLSANQATFMDTWETWYPDADTENVNFFTVDEFKQSPSNGPFDVEPQPPELIDNTLIPWV